MSAALTPPEVLERLQAVTGLAGEKLARELGVDTRLFMRWKAGSVEPGWKNAITLLYRAGFLVDGDEATNLAELRQMRDRLRKLADEAEALARDAER